MEEHTLPDKKKEIKPRPPLEYPKEDFDLAYVAEDYSEGVSGNSIIVVLSQFSGRNKIPKLLKFSFIDDKWELTDENV